MIKIEETLIWQDAKTKIIDYLENNFLNYEVLFAKVFDYGVYMDNETKAYSVLEEWGLYEALVTVMDYEYEVFGNSSINPHSYIAIANAIFYIAGEKIMNEMMEHCPISTLEWNNKATKETNDKIIKWLKEWEES